MRVISSPAPRPSITIEFTAKEQDVLYCVCRHIGGNPNATPRAVVDQLAEILGNAGAREAVPVSGSLIVGWS